MSNLEMKLAIHEPEIARETYYVLASWGTSLIEIPDFYLSEPVKRASTTLALHSAKIDMDLGVRIAEAREAYKEGRTKELGSFSDME